MEESNLKTIIKNKISNISYSKHKISDILKENNVWEEEWNKIKDSFNFNRFESAKSLLEIGSILKISRELNLQTMLKNTASR